jgi:hypothetical protein
MGQYGRRGGQTLEEISDRHRRAVLMARYYSISAYLPKKTIILLQPCA